MMLRINCPSCGVRSMIAADQVPLGRFRVSCNRCAARFPFDKERGLNCVQEKKEAGSWRRDGWRVNIPVCHGIEYSLSGLNALARSGLLQPETEIVPPGEMQFVRAREIPQLRRLFDRARETVRQ